MKGTKTKKQILVISFLWIYIQPLLGNDYYTPIIGPHSFNNNDTVTTDSVGISDNVDGGSGIQVLANGKITTTVNSTNNSVRGVELYNGTTNDLGKGSIIIATSLIGTGIGISDTSNNATHLKANSLTVTVDSQGIARELIFMQSIMVEV